MNLALQLRTIAELTQEQAAKVLDISSRTWRNWEADNPPMPEKKVEQFKYLIANPPAPTSSEDLFRRLAGTQFELPPCLRRAKAVKAKDLKPLSRQADLEPEPILLESMTQADLKAAQKAAEFDEGQT